MGNIDETQALKIFSSCIKTVYMNDESYEMVDYSEKEKEDFLDDMSAKQLEKMQSFFGNLPKISKTEIYIYITPDDPTDTYEEEVVIEGIMNFLS